MLTRWLITIALAFSLAGCAAGKPTSTHRSAVPGAPGGSTDRLDPTRGPVAAPEFTLATSDGSTLTLSEARGYWVVLTFFPARDLPECACQTTEYTPSLESMRDLPALVLAVTDLNAEALEIRRAKYAMQAYLGSDTDRTVVHRYGAWDDSPDLAGRRGRIQRATYLIDPNGRIVHRWIDPDTATFIPDLRARLADATE